MNKDELFVKIRLLFAPMRHLKKGRKFGRERDQRRAMLKSLASSFFMFGKIKTTEAKAKELRPYVEKIITRAKSSTPANRRLLLVLFTNGVVKKLIADAEGVRSRSGGYTRIIKGGARKIDGAKMAIIELVK